MCDTVVVVQPGSVLFAKNSDRDPNEAQFPEWRPRQYHAPDAMLRCTWIEIPQASETAAVLISRPYWMWGAEIGTNEYGVVIGNEAVFTNQPYARSGLTGMDLVRLALERGQSAQAACDVIVQLLEEHGQGGGCGLENPRFTYHNSFLIADPHAAIVLETAGRKWAAEHVYGVRAISNGLSIPDFAQAHSDKLRSRIAACRLRRDRTEQVAQSAHTPADLFRLLRDHATPSGNPSYSPVNGGMHAPCMHAGGLIANAQTTASWVSVLTPNEHQHWITATAAPCLSLFKPVQVLTPANIGPLPGPSADTSLWWLHERLHRQVTQDPDTLLHSFRHECDAIEANWLATPPDSSLAFLQHTDLIRQSLASIDQQPHSDMRPFYTRRYWQRRNRWARLNI